jgi:hypothetical protein
MNPKRKIDDLSYKTLVRSLIHFKLSRNNVDSKSEAIDIILAYFNSKKMKLQYECAECGTDIPDLKRCPWCGIELEYDEEEQKKRLMNLKRGIPKGLYRGSVRGRPKDVDKSVTGKRLLVRLINLVGIPKELVRVNRTYVSLWQRNGLFAQCFIGARSLRVKMPFKRSDFDDKNNIVINLDCSHHGMLSRISMERFDQVPAAAEVLRQAAYKIKIKDEKRE